MHSSVSEGVVITVQELQFIRQTAKETYTLHQKTAIQPFPFMCLQFAFIFLLFQYATSLIYFLQDILLFVYLHLDTLSTT